MADRTLIIGDTHGCIKTFSRMLFEILKVTKDDHIYLLGDYIDRGPDSRGVIDIIISLRDSGHRIFPIMGNHEFMLLQSLGSLRNFSDWMNNGAKSTLDSFGVDFPDRLPKKYREFFESLPYYYKLKDFIIVHGGLNFDITDPLNDKEAMVWTRNKEVYPEKIGGRKIIVGHTPVPLEIVNSTLNENKIMLDGGCVYYKIHEGLGYLCALELEGMKLYTQLNIE